MRGNPAVLRQSRARGSAPSLGELRNLTPARFGLFYHFVKGSRLPFGPHRNRHLETLQPRPWTARARGEGLSPKPRRDDPRRPLVGLFRGRRGRAPRSVNLGLQPDGGQPAPPPSPAPSEALGDLPTVAGQNLTFVLPPTIPLSQMQSTLLPSLHSPKQH